MSEVDNNGLIIKFVSEDLPRYRKIVTAAVKQIRGALDSASEDLRRDRDFVIASLNQDGQAIEFTSEDLRRYM